MRLGVQRRGFFPEGAPRRQHRHSAIRVLEEVRIVIRRIGVDDLLFDRPWIAARAELQLYPRRDVGHAFILLLGQRGRVVKVHGLTIALVDLQ